MAQSNELPGREALTYSIEWRLITAGKANIDWRQDRDGAQIDLRVESVGLVSKLFRVEDDYRARLSPALCTESAQLTSHEGSRERETRIAYDGAAHKAAYLERDRPTEHGAAATRNRDPRLRARCGRWRCTVMRTLNLEPGQSTTVPVSDGRKFAMAKVEAQQREDVKAPEGVFHTIRYEVYLFDNVIYRRPARLDVWLTDDRHRLPVQIRVRMQIAIGTITLLLEKHE